MGFPRIALTSVRFWSASSVIADAARYRARRERQLRQASVTRLGKPIAIILPDRATSMSVIPVHRRARRPPDGGQHVATPRATVMPHAPVVTGPGRHEDAVVQRALGGLGVVAGWPSGWAGR